MNATGYAELLPALSGEYTLAEGAERMRRNTRAYARRQLTWLRHQLPPGAVWVDPTDQTLDTVAERVVREWNRPRGGTVEAGAERPSPHDETRTERRNAE